MTPGFATRLHHRVQELNTRVCLGLDPRPALHQSTDPARLEHDPAQVARAVVVYFRKVIEATSGLIACCKPQVAFFEAMGIPGMIALAQITADLRELGIPVIADAKRGDLDTTAAAYASTWLGTGVWSADALTVNPWMGSDSLMPFSDAALENSRGIYVLVRTSNPGGRDLQELLDRDGVSVAERAADMVARLGEEAAAIGATDPAGYSHVGAVVGATLDPAVIGSLRQRMPRALLLLPGYGAQGGTAAAAAAGFDSNGLGAVVSASRSLTYFGYAADPAEPAREAALAMRDAINEALG